MQPVQGSSEFRVVELRSAEPNKFLQFIRSPKVVSVMLFLCLAALLTANGMFHEYDDEWDNILGGLRIAQGGFSEGAGLYRGYFSHHFPLPYVISGILHLILPADFVLFRCCWSIALAGVYTCLIRRFSKTSSVFPVLPVASTLVIIAPMAWMHMLLAENIIALCVLTIVLYLWQERALPLSKKDLFLLGALPSFIVLSSIGYLFLAIAVGLAGLFLCCSRALVADEVSRTNSHRHLNRIGVFIGGSFIPLALTAMYLLSIGGVSDWYDQAVRFNQLYYFQFTGNTPAEPIGAFLFVVTGVPHAIVQTFALLSLSDLRSGGAWWIWAYAAMFMFFLAFVVSALAQRRPRIELLLTCAIGFFALSRFSPTFDFANNRNVAFYPIAIAALWALIASHQNPRKITENASLWCVILAAFAIWGWFGRPTIQPQISNQDRIASFFNQNLPANEQYWIGPFRFRSQYFIHNGEPASRYAFFLPWHAASPTIVDELIGDLERRRPPFIAFDRNFTIWGHPIRRYSKQFVRYVDKHYVRIPNSLSEGGLSIWRRRGIIPETQVLLPQSQNLQLAHSPE